MSRNYKNYCCGWDIKFEMRHDETTKEDNEFMILSNPKMKESEFDY